MHYEIHDSSGTRLLLLHGGLFDIHPQIGQLPPGKLAKRPIEWLELLVQVIVATIGVALLSTLIPAG